MKTINTIYVLVILVGVLGIVLTYSRKKENFNDDANLILTNFLNTQKAQTDEISKIFTVNGDFAKTNKILEASTIRTDNDPITFKTQRNNDANVNMMITNAQGLVISGPGKWVNKEEYKNYPGLTIRNKDHPDTHFGWSDGKNYIRGTRTRFDHDVEFSNRIWVNQGDGKVEAKQLCLDGLCINADHLRVLRGEKNVHLKNNGKGALIDCGGKSGDGASTQGMRDGKTCYINDNNTGNTNQQFRLVF